VEAVIEVVGLRFVCREGICSSKEWPCNMCLRGILSLRL
jgi:hypothetical protein